MSIQFIEQPHLWLWEVRRALPDILEFLYFDNISLGLDCEAGTALSGHVTPSANFLWYIWDFSFNLEILLGFGSAEQGVLRLNKLNFP